MNKLFCVTLCALLIAPLQAAEKQATTTQLAIPVKRTIVKEVKQALIQQNIAAINTIHPAVLQNKRKDIHDEILNSAYTAFDIERHVFLIPLSWDIYTYPAALALISAACILQNPISVSIAHLLETFFKNNAIKISYKHILIGTFFLTMYLLGKEIGRINAIKEHNIFIQTMQKTLETLKNTDQQEYKQVYIQHVFGIKENL